MQSREEIQRILLETLNNFWGYTSFRDSQKEIIFSVIEQKDTLALLPTGGGKSLCYQLPALCMEGVCLVVSPLLALMKDQVGNLKSLGIEAEYLSSELDEYEQESIYEKAIRGDVKLLYVSPERLSNTLFLRKIMEVKLSFIAVDEAHCISEWGQDFRPSYGHIREFRKMFDKLPCLALTATATPKVVSDIQEKLDLKSAQIFQKSYKRNNLSIFIEEISDKYQWILNFIKTNPISGIIYVRTRKDAENLYNFLRREGINNADFYHAGLPVSEKNKKQKKWQKSNNEVLISTNAFGMGIDKDNVRFVVHFSPSGSLENYYQEIGRAGRDGQESKVFLLWNEQEISEIDDILYSQVPNKIEFLKLISSLYSKLQIAEGERPESAYQLDLKKINQFTKISYTKIKNILKFLHNQEIVYWNHFESLSTLLLRLSPDDLDFLPPQEAYFVELLFRNLAGLAGGKVRFSERALSEKFKINAEDVKNKILKLQEKGYLEYIDGSQDSIIFLSHRNDREMQGKNWKLFEKIQRNKLQKWEEMKYFLRNKDFCKMKMILAYFGEKYAQNCHKCYICKPSTEMQKSLTDEILEVLKNSPLGFDELRIKLYQYDKEEVYETLISLLNLGKIKMWNYKTYMINE
ncbi:MAG: RecQ family ATP-dependent DNA helicase [Flavobacteriaceae bacterium]|nr:RecQ family ATP-dependent DNA helicase [Flavobacteriaceae bacterium]